MPMPPIVGQGRGEERSGGRQHEIVCLSGNEGLSLCDDIESQERVEIDYNIRNDGLLNRGCNASYAGVVAVDFKRASDPRHLVARLTFGEGKLEVEGSPYKHHHGDV